MSRILATSRSAACIMRMIINTCVCWHTTVGAHSNHGKACSMPPKLLLASTKSSQTNTCDVTYQQEICRHPVILMRHSWSLHLLLESSWGQTPLNLRCNWYYHKIFTIWYIKRILVRNSMHNNVFCPAYCSEACVTDPYLWRCWGWP